MNDSTRVHYKVWDKGCFPDRDGQYLVFVHGFGCDVNSWEAQFDAFKDRKGVSLVFLDLPGYGESSKPHTDYTLDYFSSAVMRVIDEIGAGAEFADGSSAGHGQCSDLKFNEINNGGPDGPPLLLSQRFSTSCQAS